jgi:hypothetical protein
MLMAARPSSASPSELCYGDKGAGKNVKPGDVCLFTFEMIEVKGKFTVLNKGQGTKGDL